MTTWIALLRAVNVGGRNLVRMADLRDLLAASGYHDAQTLLQSGNLVFRGQGRSAAELEAVLERATQKRLGVDTDYFVRSSMGGPQMGAPPVMNVNQDLLRPLLYNATILVLFILPVLMIVVLGPAGIRVATSLQRLHG